ncbi:MAG TPA: exodeoxyribonuclease V subunit gamma [Solirubrobacteraceae bacterium]
MLHIHRSERADGLVEALRELLADPLPDPFAAEVVSVPTRGMERWISQRLSARLGASEGRGDGVCANVGFPPPRRLVGDAVAAAAGVDPERDPWRPERSVWSLLEVVDARLHEPWLATLAAHLGAGEDPLRKGRRFAVVRHLAELFDRCALHRPAMVRAWADGEGDAWQPRLWRELREAIGQPGPAERVEAACATLRERPAVVDLPRRVALFNLTRLPAGYRDVLAALAAEREVHLFLLHPSPALWDRIAAGDGPPAAIRRVDHPTAGAPENRLLASWGQDAREMQLVLAGADARVADRHHPVEHPEDTLLARIQADVRADRRPPGEPLPGAPDERPLLEPHDRSVQVHACHGRARQVEVLRDAILHLLEDDPTLEPRDVIVMCPDVEAFAPLVHATFGAAAAAEDDETLTPDVKADLRVRLADRSLRQTNPLLGVTAQLLDLAGQRLTASQVLDLANREPVRRRFGFDDDALVRIEDWVAQSGIRWGLDAEHRAPFGLEALKNGTWRAGLDRVLVGVTMTEDERRLLGDVLPLDDVDSGVIELAGRFAELVDRLGAALDELARPRAVAEWTTTIAEATGLLADTSPGDAWQRTELQRILDDVAGEAEGSAATLALPEVRSLLADRLAGRPTRANFRTGHLTVCTLVPMRSVPHRVVCLLGLDDAVFPRKGVRDGDDLLLADPHVGERDPRAEDRQLTLDALMAAGERLIVTYTGNDERTNAVRPPAVPVGELLDAVDRTVRLRDGAPARERVLVRHPLQPFDRRNFVAGCLGADGPWRFDRVALAGARAIEAGRGDPRPFLAAPLPGEPAPLVELADLVRFVQHPVKAFLRLRLGVSLEDFSTEVEDGLPVQLEGLETWQVGDRILDAVLAGCEPRAACEAEIARGLLPPGVLGKPVIDEVWPTVDGIVAVAHEELGGTDAGAEEVRAELPGGRVLGGTVAGVRGEVLRAAAFSRVGAKQRLAAWVRVLALTAADPERPWRAVTIGRRRGGGEGVTVARIPVLGPDPQARRAYAQARLGELLDLFDRGMREPLPLFCKTSAVYAETARTGRDALRAARSAWESAPYNPRENAEPEHQLVFGGQRSFDEVRAEPPRDDERGHGWDVSEPSRFGRLALRLWAHLLDVEEVEDR